MGMELTPEARKRLFDAYMAETGGRIPDMPNGPMLDEFRALEMAQAIESELNRSALCGFTKVTLTFHLKDAAEFAAFLRRAASAGV